MQAETSVREKFGGVNLWPSRQRAFHSAVCLPSSWLCLKG